jgi:probable HAF family extracellular repeat protein
MARLSSWRPAAWCLASSALALFPSPISAAPADTCYVVTDLSASVHSPKGINAVGDVVGITSVPCGSSNIQFLCPRAVRYDAHTGLTAEMGIVGAGTSFYYSYAYGINAGGDAVGTSQVSPGQQSPICATRYPAGGGRECLVTEGSSEALAINDAGVIVGYLADGNDIYRNRAFIVDGGTVIDLHPEIIEYEPGAMQSQATAINSAGDVAGWYYDAGFTKVGFVRHRPVGDQPPVYEFLGLPGELAGASTDTTGINAAGQVIATTNLWSGNWPLRAIRWTAGIPQDLGVLEGAELEGSAALGINGRGDVVGGAYYEFICGDWGCAIGTHAFLYRDGVMHDLNDLIPPDSGWTLYKAVAINDAGQITAEGGHTSGRSGAVLLSPCATAMIGSLVELVEGFGLPKGLETSYVAQLRHALAALEAGDVATACGALLDFINHTGAQAGKKLTVEQADAMIGGAEAIRAAIGCP